MFSVRINKPLRVYRSGSFKTAEGAEGAYVILRECDNQPPELERPSKSRNPVKIWLDRLPSNVVNDGWIIFDKMIGFDWKSVPATDINGNRLKDRLGHDIFNPEIVAIVEGLTAFDMDKEKAKK